MTKPWRIVQGGQGASKNWSIATILLELASEKKRTITIVMDTFSNLQDGIIKDYKDMFHLNGLDFNDFYNAQNKDLKWGDSVVQFRYVVGHKAEAGKSKRRDILYVNETSKVSYAAIQHYIARTAEVCFFDLNPDYKTWVHSKILPDTRAERLIVTHWDNEFLPQGERDYIENRKHMTEWYKVYGLGIMGTYSERRVYQFSMADNGIPSAAKRLPRGMDFGKSPDPTCLVDLYLDGTTLYLDEVFQENDLQQERIEGSDKRSIVDKMDELTMECVRKVIPKEKFTKNNSFYLYDKRTEKTTDEQLIIKEIKSVKSWLIVADSAGSTEIRDLRKHGYNVRGVGKPKGSVETGIGRVQSYDLKLTRRSENIKNGMESWLRKEDDEGNIIAEPDGHEPDTLAAVRYVCFAKTLWR